MTKFVPENAIRILSADAVEKAKSGHPGFPLGAAPIIYELFARHLRHNPKNPDWFGRDRFVLSAGHGSAMLYAALHLFGYEDVTIEQLKAFRQLGSLTPGHPEYGHTKGVDATTGPLGAGLGMAVGMAMAEAHLAKIFNKPGLPLVDHYTFTLCGDGCLMEGISSEAMSLAGTLGLSKLIVLYDSNRISIEGSTDLAFTEDVMKRFEAFGFRTIEVADGTDTEEIGRAIVMAKSDEKRPSFIKINTHIGYGVPAKQDSASAHGEPLGEENVRILRENLGWAWDEAFYVPPEIYDHYHESAEKGGKANADWDALKNSYAAAEPDAFALFERYSARGLPEGAAAFLSETAVQEKADATRSVSGRILNAVKEDMPWLIGGSADLAPSNKTALTEAGDFSKLTPEGRNIHFGVRELGMGAIALGLCLHGGLIPYVSTFLVFSDYLKPMIRLAALMKLPILYIFTHDSIGVGEDGPTHEPVEQLAMLRSIPGVQVFRPADANETRAAYYSALTSGVPSVFALSRQNLPPIGGDVKDAMKGGYILSLEAGESPDVILMASGSEVSVCLDAKKLLAEKGLDARVVSMPSMEVFERQPAAYRGDVLPPSVTKRVAVEAASRQPWGRYVGLDGDFVTMDGFGASAPAPALFERFGFTAENVAAKALALFS
ncbi:MAG: transketolase [Clostridiales Family XIII bacterium]|jgi:transketolase|nr:transketolase [Clostridiales Family XIII bacterium]